MAVLFAAQSLLHCLAVFGSALADCAKVSSPTNATHAAAVKVGLITHSPGNIPLDACDFEAPRGAKLPRWPIAGRNEPDRPMFILCSCLVVKNKKRTRAK